MNRFQQQSFTLELFQQITKSVHTGTSRQAIHQVTAVPGTVHTEKSQSHSPSRCRRGWPCPPPSSWCPARQPWCWAGRQTCPSQLSGTPPSAQKCSVTHLPPFTHASSLPLNFLCESRNIYREQWSYNRYMWGAKRSPEIFTKFSEVIRSDAYHTTVRCKRTWSYRFCSLEHNQFFQEDSSPPYAPMSPWRWQSPSKRKVLDICRPKWRQGLISTNEVEHTTVVTGVSYIKHHQTGLPWTYLLHTLLFHPRENTDDSYTEDTKHHQHQRIFMQNKRESCIRKQTTTKTVQHSRCLSCR